MLSEPLDRSRPLWHVHLVPQLADGTVGLILKAHHAMVDGLSALALGLLLLDLDPDPQPLPAPDAPAWKPDPPPGAVRLAVDALADQATETLRAAGQAARLVGSGRRIGDTLRRTALTVGEDVLRPAPSSYLNRRIGARRALAGHRVAIDELLAIRARPGHDAQRRRADRRHRRAAPDRARAGRRCRRR